VQEHPFPIPAGGFEPRKDGALISTVPEECEKEESVNPVQSLLGPLRGSRILARRGDTERPPQSHPDTKNEKERRFFFSSSFLLCASSQTPKAIGPDPFLRLSHDPRNRKSRTMKDKQNRLPYEGNGPRNPPPARALFPNSACGSLLTEMRFMMMIGFIVPRKREESSAFSGK